MISVYDLNSLSRVVGLSLVVWVNDCCVVQARPHSNWQKVFGAPVKSGKAE